MNTTNRSLFFLVGVALLSSACITPTGKPYDERLAARLELGTRDKDVVAALGRPWQAEPLGLSQDSVCAGRVESWKYSYERIAKVQCTTTLKFDERGALCFKESSTTLPGAQCQGAK